MNFRNLLPNASDYTGLRRTWRKDLMAGVTVGIVALPLALAFGVSSGAGAESGLITAIIAGLVAAIFGGSNVQVSGPTGAMVVVLGPIVAQHGVGAIALVSVMAGAIVLLAGILRLGRTISYIPWPVIEGFTLGIAVIIFLQQVPAAIGATATPGRNSLLDAVANLAQIDLGVAWAPLLLVAIVVITMLVVPMIHPALPSSLIAVVLATLIAIFFKLETVSIGELPSSLPAPHMPEVNFALVTSLFGPALAVAALAAIESLLSARVASTISTTGPYDADRELFGQGLASVASGFFGGMPATGAIARTAVNIRAGGQTRVSVIVHALVLLVVVYAASTVVSVIPLAALAGVLMVTSVRMVSPKTVRTIIKSTRADALIFVMTALITVSFDLIYAVVIGVAAAGLAALLQLAKTSGVTRETLPEPAQPGDETIALFRIDGALFFGTAERIWRDLQKTKNISVVILRMSKLQMLDATGAQVLTELVRTLEAEGITVLIKGIQDSHTRLIEKVGVVASLRHQNHLFSSLDEAIMHARTHI